MEIPSHILRGELIGLHITVSGTQITGIIVDETKNTFVIKTTAGERRLQKASHSFDVIIDDIKYHIQGSKILMRPEDRIKMKLK